MGPSAREPKTRISGFCFQPNPGPQLEFQGSCFQENQGASMYPPCSGAQTRISGFLFPSQFEAKLEFQGSCYHPKLGPQPSALRCLLFIIVSVNFNLSNPECLPFKIMEWCLIDLSKNENSKTISPNKNLIHDLRPYLTFYRCYFHKHLKKSLYMARGWICPNSFYC